jgi:HEAT repeat protein
VLLMKMLENTGRAEVVPALTKELDDKDPLIQESARRALQNNPSPEAAAALLTALNAAKTPDWQTANAIALGSRSDAAAVAAIAKVAAGTDADEAKAAVTALGNIGTPAAVKAIEAIPVGSPSHQMAMNSLFHSAEKMVANGQKAAAADIYRSLYTPDQAKLNRIAALHGLALSMGAAAIPMLAAALTGTDTELSAAASSFIPEIPGSDATRALAKLLPETPPAGAILLLGQLGERGDVAARPEVAQDVKNADAGVRIAAIDALAMVGTAADVPLLAGVAAKGPGPEADAARDSLAHLKGADVNAALLRVASAGAPAARAEGIRALAARGAKDSVPQLVGLLRDTNSVVRTACVSALGVLGDATSVQPIVTALTAATTDDQRTAESNAMVAIINRLPDHTVAAGPILAALPGANNEARLTLLDLLKNTGGADALQAAQAATTDPNADVSDTAVRTLAAWPDSSAMDDLLAIAKTSTSQAHQVLALRGYVRLVGIADMTPDQKVALVQAAMPLAKRVEDKRLVLSGLAAVKDPAALKAVDGYLDDPALQEAAAASAVEIARGLGGTAGPGVVDLMKRVIQLTQNKDTIDKANAIINAPGVTMRGWRVIGPFPFDATNFDKNFGPEGPVDLNKSYPGVNGPVRWKPAVVEPNGYVNLLNQFDPNQNVQIYALVYVKSPTDQKAVFSMGSDDGIKAWLNGKQVHSNNASRPASPGEDQVPVDLKAGWNTVLLKITQGSGDWGYYFDILTPDKKAMTDITYGPAPEG